MKHQEDYESAQLCPHDLRPLLGGVAQSFGSSTKSWWSPPCTSFVATRFAAIASLALCLVVFNRGLSHAEEPVGPRANERTTATFEDYRLPIQVADAVAATLTFVALINAGPCSSASQSDNDGNDGGNSCGVALGSGAAALLTYALASPIVHLTMENPRGAGLSLALRVGAPLGLSLLGASGGDDLLVLGALIGAGAAAATDWFLLSKRERVESSSLSPIVSVTPNGNWQLGLAGSF